MTLVQSAAKFPLLVSREQARNAIGNALRLFVGRGRRYSVKQLSNATGVPDWQINTALIDGGSPDNRPLPPEALLSITTFLGAVFTNEWLRHTNQGAFDLPDGEEPDPMSVAAEAAEDTAEVVRMAADQAWDGAERQRLPEIGRRKIERGMMLVAAGRAA
ncbi:hypothetical protein [Sphingomonas sp.]|jgi:hypothetical protein|uniref:hypothetical protein n=1 Tax=Sphingomonas sp. TaxID=28214 RepID=UPI0035C7AF37